MSGLATCLQCRSLTYIHDHEAGLCGRCRSKKQDEASLRLQALLERLLSDDPNIIAALERLGSD